MDRDELIYRSDLSMPGPHVVGEKAWGLGQIPSKWIPPFFAIRARGLVDPEHLPTETVTQALKELVGETATPLIVRSSAPKESLSDRGRFESFQCPSATAMAVTNAANAVVASLKYAPSYSSMAAIVQRYITPKRFGHLSNERRVSREISSWHLEHQVTSTSPPAVETFSVKRTADGDVLLACRKSAELDKALKSIGNYFSKKKQRVHIEWIWDGQRVWVVQCDHEAEVEGHTPGTRWQRLAQPPKVEQLRVLVPAVDSREVWPKTKAVRKFHECGQPVAEVFVLEDEKTLEELSRGVAASEMVSDLEVLLNVPVLIRTDYSERVLSSGMLLPRTGAVSDIDNAILFLHENARKNIEADISELDFCFTIHRFIAAKGAAFSLSKPGVSRVHIDSTWGSPDSLNYYPHDSFEVDVRDRVIRKKKIRCKTDYLDMATDGSWVEVQSGGPWDWKPSLTEDELFEIADGACRIADGYGCPIETMYFTGVISNEKAICLPWFCTEKIAPKIEQVTGIRFSGKRLTVTNESDVKQVQRQWRDKTLTKPFGIRLRPDPSSMRSKEFLSEVASIAKAADVAVELEGSILQHCFYILRQEGVKVTCVDLLEEAHVQRRFGKLVRDKIPLRIESHGEKPYFVNVTEDDLLHLLKSKAIEEAFEFFWETRDERIVEELADLLEVVESAARLCGMSLAELSKVAEAKRTERGGFEEGVVLLETQSVPLIARDLREYGLFDNDDEPSTPRVSQDDFSVLRRPRSEGERLVISLIPPDSAERPRDSVVAFDGGNLEAIISYEGSEATIRLRRVEGTPENPRQMRFSFDEDGV